MDGRQGQMRIRDRLGSTRWANPKRTKEGNPWAEGLCKICGIREDEKADRGSCEKRHLPLRMRQLLGKHHHHQTHWTKTALVFLQAKFEELQKKVSSSCAEKRGREITTDYPGLRPADAFQ